MRSSIHRFLYNILLCGLAASMTTSVFLTNMAWVFLFANWVLEWNWHEKFADFRHNRPLHAILALAGVYLLWSIGCDNTGQTLEVLRIKMPLLAIPLVVLTSKPLQRREAFCVAVSYLVALLTMTAIGLVRYLTIPDLPYRDIIPHISNIRFGLNICFAIVLLAYLAYRHPRPWQVAATAALILWLLAFLLMLRAYTAFIVLMVLALVLPIAYRRRLPKVTRRVALALGIAVWLLVAGTAIYYHHDYYTLRTPSTAAVLPPLTANGNAYLHRQDGLIENGNYVHKYVCEKEMRSEWQKLSTYPFDSLTPVGYTVYPALLRYLNALGVTKDSLGMQCLTPDDVAAIEQGIANPVYLQHGPRKLFYVLFYEYENYRCYRSVSNFSTLQRLELWEAGWHISTRHPLLGVGTGDVNDALQQELTRMHSPLRDSGLHLHNQFLTFLVAFGWLGFLIIAFFFLRAILPERIRKPRRKQAPAQFSILNSQLSTLFTAHTVIVLISFLSDNTLSTLAGITFVALGYSLLETKTITKTKTETAPAHL